jgi:hypothetical protein
MTTIEAHGQPVEKHDPKTFTIIVNARERTVTGPEITFEQVVKLAFENQPPPGSDVVFTVTYRRGIGEKPEGSLIEGHSVKVKEGMVFNVTETSKS